MKEFLKSNLLLIIGGLIGLITGFMYWKLIGCNSGTCAITSNPTNSTLYGGVLGGLIFSMFKKDKKQ